MPAPQRGVIQWFAVLMLVGASATALTGAQYAVDQRNLEESAAAPETVVEPESVPGAIDTPEPAIAPALVAETAPAISRLDRTVTRPDKVSIAAVPPSPQEAPARSSEVVPSVIAPPVRHVATADVALKPEPTVAPVPEKVIAPEAAAIPTEPVIAPVAKEPVSAEVPRAPTLGGGTVRTPVGPKYPRQAKLRGIEGFVKVGYVVNREGRVENVEILDAVPAQIFDNTVVKALRKWRYEPFTVDGVPSDQTVTQVFEFNVERGGLEETEKPARCRRSTGTRLCRDSMDPGIVGVSVVYNTL
jgi:protein TonB